MQIPRDHTSSFPPIEKSSIRPVIATRVGSPEEFIERKFTGQAKPSQEINLAFRVEGPLVALHVDVGDVVNKGGLVVKIDPRDYEVNLRNVQGSLQRSRAQATRAQADLQRLLKVQKEDPGATIH